MTGLEKIHLIDIIYGYSKCGRTSIRVKVLEVMGNSTSMI
jgi:hypothetical protein